MKVDLKSIVEGTPVGVPIAIGAAVGYGALLYKRRTEVPCDECLEMQRRRVGELFVVGLGGLVGYALYELAKRVT